MLNPHPHFPTPTFRHRLGYDYQATDLRPVLPVDRAALRGLRIALPLSLLLWAGLAGCVAAVIGLLG